MKAAQVGVRVIIFREACPINARRLTKQGQAPDGPWWPSRPRAAWMSVNNSLACPAFRRQDQTCVSVDESLCSGCMFCLQLDKAFKAKKRGE